MSSTTFIPRTPGNTDVTVVNNGWYPDVSMRAFRDAMRIGEDVDNAELMARLEEAVLGVNATLKDWLAKQRAAGYAALANVPADTYGDETELEKLYRQAVYAWAKRLLVEQQRGLDTQRAGQDRADVMAPAIDDLRIQHDRAIRAIQGEEGSIFVTSL